MTREEMYDLIMGAAVVTIGYMLWKQHKTRAGNASTGPAINIPAPPAVEGNDETGYYFDLDKLLEGVL